MALARSPVLLEWLSGGWLDIDSLSSIIVTKFPMAVKVEMIGNDKDNKNDPDNKNDTNNKNDTDNKFLVTRLVI